MASHSRTRTAGWWLSMMPDGTIIARGRGRPLPGQQHGAMTRKRRGLQGCPLASRAPQRRNLCIPAGTRWNRVAFRVRGCDRGTAAQLRYDSAGRLTEVKRSLEQRSFLLSLLCAQPEFESPKLLVQNKAPLLVARYDYDALGRLIAVTDPTDNAIRYEYDAQGHLVVETNRTGGAYFMRYDMTGKCVQIGRADGTHRQTLEIDETTRITRSIDSLGRITTYHWNEKGRFSRPSRRLGRERKISMTNTAG